VGIINWISTNSANLLLVGVTFYYAFITHKILSETRKEHEALFRPYIAISPVVYPGDSIIHLRIKNAGKTSAENLRFTLDRDFYQFGQKEHNIREFSIFKEKIASFAPEEEMVFALAQGTDIFRQEVDPKVIPSQFTITVEYEYYWEKRKRIEENIVVDLRPYERSRIFQEPLKEIASALKEIKNSIKEVSK